MSEHNEHHPSNESTQHDTVASECAPANGADAASQTKGESGDVLDLIADVEQQLASLKAVHRERETAVMNLAEREQAVAKREDDVRHHLEQVIAEKETLESARDENAQNERLLAQQQRDLDAIDAELNERRQQLEAHQAEVESRGSQLNEIAQQLDTERNTLDAERSKAHAEREAFEQRASDVEAESERLRQQIDSLQSERDEMAARLEAATTEANDLRDRLESATQATASLEERLRAELADVERSSSETLDALAVEHGAELEQLRSQVAQARGQAEEAQARASESDREAETLQAKVLDLQSAAGELEARFATERESLTSAEAALRERVGELTSALETEQSAFRAVTEERDVLSERVRTLAEKFKEMSAALVEQTGLVANDAALAEAEVRNRTLVAQLDEAKQAVAEASARADAAERAVVEQQEAATASVADSQEQHEQDARIEVLQGELVTLREALAEAEARAVQATKAMEAAVAERTRSRSGVGGTGSATAPDPAMRRVRLARAKRLVQSQAAKVRRASEALTRRYQQCEDLLMQRADVVRAKQRLESIERKVARTSSTKAFGLSVLCVCVTIGLLAVLSVAGARQFWPGRFLAHAVIEIDPGDRMIGPEAEASWTMAHQDLAQDPHFLESVAERMRRRGIATLGTAPAISAYFNEYLVIESPEPGRLTFALEGDGQDRTQRILQTYAVTLANQANQSRARRLDGAGTRISQDAVAETSPVDESELMHAGMIFGGAFGVVFLLGGGIASRMVNTKKKFEYDETVERVLDEARWVDPREAAERHGRNPGDSAH